MLNIQNLAGDNRDIFARKVFRKMVIKIWKRFSLVKILMNKKKYLTEVIHRFSNNFQHSIIFLLMNLNFVYLLDIIIFILLIIR